MLRKTAPEAVKDLKTAVACHDANGAPALFFCRVRCRPDPYDDGDHYDAAQLAATEAAYEQPMVAADENDPMRAVMGLADRAAAPVVDITADPLLGG